LKRNISTVATSGWRSPSKSPMVNCESANAATQWRSGAIEALGQAAERSAGAAAEAHAENASENKTEQQMASHKRMRHFPAPAAVSIFICATLLFIAFPGP
jgi:hypothetical protein